MKYSLHLLRVHFKGDGEGRMDCWWRCFWGMQNLNLSRGHGILNCSWSMLGRRRRFWWSWLDDDTSEGNEDESGGGKDQEWLGPLFLSLLFYFLWFWWIIIISANNRSLSEEEDSEKHNIERATNWGLTAEDQEMVSKRSWRWLIICRCFPVWSLFTPSERILRD